MKILITGCNGFIGSNLLSFLKKKKIDTIGWDISQTSNQNCRKIDMLNLDEVKRSLLFDKPTTIIHCAGAADVNKSFLNPQLDYMLNVSITNNLIIASSNVKEIKEFVFLSSASVYGNPDHLPIDESCPINPLSPYALHKAMAEDICKYYSANYQTNVKIIRIFSAYGKGLKKQIFWDVFQRYKETGHLSFWGTGKESRDYIYISDLINAIWLIAKKANQNDIIFNVGNGKEVFMSDIATLYSKYLKCKPDENLFNNVSKPGIPINWRADISKLKSLGYKQRISFEEGLKDYIDWLK